MIRNPASGCVFLLVACGLLVGACGAPDEGSPIESAQSDAEPVIVSNVTDGTYILRAVHASKCLDVSGASKADGARVQQWSCNGTGAQLFRFSSVGGGHFSITNVNSGKAVEIADGSTSENAQVVQRQHHGGQNQRFSFVNRGGNEFSIHAAHTGMALDVTWGRAADGTSVVQYPYHGTSNQRWTLDKVSGGDTAGDGGAGGTWRTATLTWFESYPDPGSEECIEYNGCTWAGQFAALDGQQPESWVRANNIAAVHSKDFAAYRLKTLRLRKNGREIDVKVYDMCADSDCSGCCTQNARPSGNLIDLEKHTAERFGVPAEGQVEWRCLDCD
ncbi:RICIN domain-containing protein [Sorangium sp. So ce887]|uniref:RICIN domain-containing protein n=1 Tax=Sorangium sp. So ce887 TaxID=3133324 RepID=UPI003F632332